MTDYNRLLLKKINEKHGIDYIYVDKQRDDFFDTEKYVSLRNPRNNEYVMFIIPNSIKDNDEMEQYYNKFITECLPKLKH